MKRYRIALQVYSVRDFAEKEFALTMRKIKAMGYDGVELAGTYGMTAVQCKEILDGVGLELAGAHVSTKFLEDDAVLDDYVSAGLHYIVVPWYTGPKNTQELHASIAHLRAIAERCKTKGLQLLYHNHDFEFVKIDGEYILDAYYRSISADLLQTELDTCWVNVGGENPAEYVRKYAGRAPIVHIKDFAGRKTDNMYALIGNSTAKEDSTGVFEYRPVGFGLQDIPAILDAAVSADASWIVVEQDRPSMGKTSLECAEMSIRYLKRL